MLYYTGFILAPGTVDSSLNIDPYKDYSAIIYPTNTVDYSNLSTDSYTPTYSDSAINYRFIALKFNASHSFNYFKLKFEDTNLDESNKVSSSPAGSYHFGTNMLIYFMLYSLSY